jgi:hypothetical protein
MDQQEFARLLCEVLGIRNVPDVSKRACYIVVVDAAYGRPSSVVIEFQGTPARFPIYMGDVGYAADDRALLVNGKFYRPGARKSACACAIIDRFLRSHGWFLQGPHPADDCSIPDGG